jgi:hypothetical protein
MNGDSGLARWAISITSSGSPLEVDAAPGLFPVAEARGFRAVATTDLARPGGDRLGGLGIGRFGLLFLRGVIHDDNGQVCQIRDTFTTLILKTNLAQSRIIHGGCDLCPSADFPPPPSG